MSTHGSGKICVIGPFPSESNSKDGAIQRVAHIDDLMTDMPRTYLKISLRRHWRRHTHAQGLVTIHRMNLVIHFFRILEILRLAQLIYVHSAGSALYLMPFPTHAKVIFDAHGVVPEELMAMGHRRWARILGWVERSILNRCDLLVCVTRSMLQHFHVKYGFKPDREEIVLPILPKFGDDECAQSAISANRDPNSVIYAGGMQVWQNVDEMINAASRQPELTYTFLTGSVNDFSAKLRAGKVQKFRCDAVAPERVKDYYLTHQYGFILRDDNIINAVACPTKLVEYLFWGVIPIVITPCIGDFDSNSLRFVTLAQFFSGDLPDAQIASEMRVQNQKTVLGMIASAKESSAWLREQFIGQA